jgi:hypothetical protein
MQLFKRPPRARGFEKAVEQHRTTIKLFFQSRVAGSTETAQFAPVWRDYKSHFAKAQRGKCGYCEMMVIGGQPGDVEHYRPKGEIWVLRDDPATWGQEKEWASTVAGRQHEVLCDQGYWWLAYEWSNYLLSCTACNSYWKLSFFPVSDNRRKLPPRWNARETALLLDPFGSSKKPQEHLRFDDLGQIEARRDSRWGYETIRTCGLDRESLRRSRQEKARRAYKLAKDLSESADDHTYGQTLRDFYELGRDEYVHSGMVRAIFEELCGLSWEKLKALVAKINVKKA